MTKPRLLVSALLVLAAVGVSGSTAVAAPPAPTTCSGGTIASGTYTGLTITGSCTFDHNAVVTVNGNLVVWPGAALNLNGEEGSDANVTVHGNATVGWGGVLGLGDYNPAGSHTSSVVDGDVIANRPLSLYLGDITVGGNVISSGGGGQAALFRSFPIKDNTIKGNLIVQGWQGAWIGLLGNDVGGNVIFWGNRAFLPGLTGQGPDSSEVVGNSVGGNLICLFNSPHASFGDADYRGPNKVGGHAIGECSTLT